MSKVLIGTYILSGTLLFAGWNNAAQAEDFSPAAAVYNSSGTVAATAVTFTQSGYVGTFVTVSTLGTVTIAVGASGNKGSNGAAPHMAVSIADTTMGWSLSSAANTYTASTVLPAGTYFLRVQYDNAPDAPGANMTLTNISVQGASVGNSTDPAVINSEALSAADTYIANFRRGSTTLNLSNIAPGGAAVQIQMVRHAFRFGEETPGFADSDIETYLAPNPAPKSTAAIYQAHFLPLFNGLTPGNAGKWAYNEATRGAVTMQGVDDTLAFAKTNRLKVRMHNLIWGSQQPNFMTQLAGACETPTVAGTNAPQQDLLSAIDFRIGYYVHDRASEYDELDVYNEPAHTGAWQPGDVQTASASAQPNYWNAIGVSGVATVFNQTAQAAAQAGNSYLPLFVNEYNVLRDSSTPPVTGPSTTQASYVNDPYANWYRQLIESIKSSGGAISGVGVEDYSNEAIATGDNSSHNPGRIIGVFNNLALLNMPIELTEFGISTPAPGTLQNFAVDSQILTETMRLAFGNPALKGFSMFGFWASDMWNLAPDAQLYDANWNLTPTGQAYIDLTNGWKTNVSTTVGQQSLVSFQGFYGDYLLTANGQRYSFTLTKGQTTPPVLTLQP